MVSFPAENGPGRVPGLFEGGRLSPTQRRVARYVADHPREAPALSGVGLAARAGGGEAAAARRAAGGGRAAAPRAPPGLASGGLAAGRGVSQPTVTRLAVALGYGGYGEFQKDLRMTVLGVAEGSGGNKFQAAVDEEIGNLRALRASLEDEGRGARLGRGLASAGALGGGGRG